MEVISLLRVRTDESTHRFCRDVWPTLEGRLVPIWVFRTRISVVIAFNDVKMPSVMDVMAEDSRCKVDSDVRLVKVAGNAPASEPLSLG